MVFGSLLEVADHCAMEIADLGLVNADLEPLCDHLVVERYLVHAPNMSLRPLGTREVLCSLLLVSKCRMMVFSSRRKVSMVFSSRRSLIVHNQSGTSRRRRSPTSRRQVGHNWYKLEGSQRLVVGR